MSHLLILTKKFPYSYQETYLFDELPILTERFRSVTIVPYDEFDLNEKENRLHLLQNISLFKLNAHIPSLTFHQKIKREFQVMKVFLSEIMGGRNAASHLKHRKIALSQLRHAYTASLSLNKYIEAKFPENEDVIFYNYWLHRGVLLSYFTKLNSDRKLPIVSRAHAYDLYHRDWLGILGKTLDFLPFESFKVKVCGRIYAISEHGLSHFKKTFPKYKNKFSISRLGVKDNLPAQTYFEAGSFTIVTCSGIDENKRIYRIPEILSKLNFEVKWVHFGSGTEQDIQQIKNEIKKYGLENKCELKGRQAHHEVINYYRYNKIDLFMNLSTVEGIPVSLMEAASFGIPMLATRTVGTPELVTSKNGVLIDVDFSSDEVSRQINGLFANKEDVQKKRQAARTTFEELYNAEKNYTAFAQQLNNL